MPMMVERELLRPGIEVGDVAIEAAWWKSVDIDPASDPLLIGRRANVERARAIKSNNCGVRRPSCQ